MFDPDIQFEIPTGGLLAEIGIDPAAVSEVIAHDRAMRCPDKDQVLPECGSAFLDVAVPQDTGPRETAPAEPFGLIPARQPAEWS